MEWGCQPTVIDPSFEVPCFMDGRDSKAPVYLFTGSQYRPLVSLAEKKSDATGQTANSAPSKFTEIAQFP